MRNGEFHEREAIQTWIEVSSVDEPFRELVEESFKAGVGAVKSGIVLPEGNSSLTNATVADYAWKVTGCTPDERNEAAGCLITTLNRYDSSYRIGVYYADQWAADVNGQWSGYLYFAVGDVDRPEAEMQRCAARDAANILLETEGSPYRLP